MTQSWLGIGFVLLMLGGLIGLLRMVKSRYILHPELVRKLLHVGMGLTTLTFPWLFDRHWPVLLLAAVTIPALCLARRVPALKSLCGGVIDGAGRDQSLGEIYFPIGVAVTFVLANGQVLPYCIPILLLTFADTAAALVGRLFGAMHYQVLDEVKSIEGSAAFFVTAFFSTEIVLLLLTNGSGTEHVLIAFLLAGITMFVEAIALRGLDNLLIPIIGFVALNSLLTMPATDLITPLLFVTVALMLGLFYHQQKKVSKHHV